MQIKLVRTPVTSAIRSLAVRTPKSLIIVSSLLIIICPALIGCGGSAAGTTPTGSAPSIQNPNSEVLLKAPEVISLQIVQATLLSSGLSLSGQAQVLNPNAVSINIDKPDISILGVTGTQYNEESLPGGQIEPISTRTIDFDIIVPTSAFNEQKLNINFNCNTLPGDSIQKVSSTTDYNISGAVRNLYLKPKTTLQADISQIHWNGLKPELEARVQGSINNPNPFCINVNNVNIAISDPRGESITSGLIPGMIVSANSDQSFQTSIMLPINLLNNPSISAKSDLSATMLYSQISSKGTAQLDVPKLRDLIKVPQITMDTESKWITVDSLSKLELIIKTTINNDNDFDLTSGNLEIKVYNPDKVLLGSVSMPGNIIDGIPRKSTRTLTNQIMLTSEDVGSKTIDANIKASIKLGMENVNEGIPLDTEMVYQLTPQE